VPKRTTLKSTLAREGILYVREGRKRSHNSLKEGYTRLLPERKQAYGSLSGLSLQKNAKAGGGRKRLTGDKKWGEMSEGGKGYARELHGQARLDTTRNVKTARSPISESVRPKARLRWRSRKELKASTSSSKRSRGKLQEDQKKNSGGRRLRVGVSQFCAFKKQDKKTYKRERPAPPVSRWEEKSATMDARGLVFTRARGLMGN